MSNIDARELELYIANDGSLYRNQTTGILRNLATKKARGEYQHDLAVKAFGYLAEAGAKKYAKEFGTPGVPWNRMFDVPTRRAVAEAFTKDFETEYKLGNYDSLLPKKYQGSVHAAVKGSKSKWKVPEGLLVRWAVPNNAWFALWPAGAPTREQQVLKIADTEAMHSWLRERYGAPYGLTSRKASHATKRVSRSAKLDREIATALRGR